MMSSKEGKVVLGKYKLDKCLGQGTFAKVFRATEIESNKIVAIKVINKENVCKKGMCNQAKREITIMNRLKHPNIVELYEVMATKEYIYLVMEYAECGDLMQKIQKGKLREEAARRYFRQLITAVDFCHRRGVNHRDLKPENLLLGKGGVLKVADFGLSALVAESERGNASLRTRCGTPYYVAPEIVWRRSGEGYDGAKADIWSCGVILFTLLAGYLPFTDYNNLELCKKIVAANYQCPSWFSDQVTELLRGMLNPRPSRRFRAADIMSSAWMQQGLNSNTITQVEQDVNEETSHDSDNDQEETITPSTLSAFDIISLSSGFDLSGLMPQNDARKSAVQFMSAQSATSIMSKLRNVARKLKMKSTKEGASLKIIKGALSMKAEIFEFTPSFHLVEMKISNGDAFEFRKMVDEDIRPALKDVACGWHGVHNNNNSVICI